MKWHIRSGTLRAVAEGRDPAEAFVAAVRKRNPKALGMIFEAVPVGTRSTPETARFGSTERVLRKAGLWEP